MHVDFFEDYIMASLQSDVKAWKRRFDKELKHVKIILTHERRRMPKHEWLQLVHATKESIIQSPADFFGNDLPSEPVFRAALEKVFDFFLEDQRLLSIQRPIIPRQPSG